MLKLCIYVCILFAAVKSSDFISEGSWRIIEIAPCDNPEQYEIWFNLTKYKLTRTKDVFDAHCSFQEDFDEFIGFKANVTKHTAGGGYKDYMMMTDESVLKFCQNHSRENHDKLKTAMGLDKDSDKIPKGVYFVKAFGVDSCEMPPQGILGVFKTEVTIISEHGKPLGCIVLTVEFREEKDDCGNEDE